MLLYGLAIFVSAFLLFEVQPIIAKMILPWFGGSAAVWSIALMFFQLALLAGYAYSYLLTRFLKPLRQAIVHITLLAASLALLPIIPSGAWKPLAAEDPVLRILMLLGATIGLPYFMLSATSPLLQVWFAAARPGAVPYRLFAVSNAGSMLGLLTFPAAVEPFLPARTQAICWSVAYVAFAVLCGIVALRAARVPQAFASLDAAADPPPWLSQLLWLALPACASALLLAITSHVTQNVAPIPFLWVLTLALYLLTFILAFENERTYRRAVFLPLLAIALAAMGFAVYFNYGNAPLFWTVPMFAAGLFIASMVCHGELARLKPHPRYLTKYYLMVALGGAIGGLFVALAAPRLFNTYLELPLSLVLCAFLAALVSWNDMPRLVLRASSALFVCALAAYLGFHAVAEQSHYIAAVRNFYGVLRVSDRLDSGEYTRARKLMNGTILHGEQLLDPRLRAEPTTYYGRQSGIGRMLTLLQRKSHIHVGVVGLGAGVLAGYCRPGDTFRFYEINPFDVVVANHYFSFLPQCPGHCAIVPGDARLSLAREAPQQFDLLVVDAFSSDSIPLHLLTREAFALYERHLNPDGVLAIHVTNRYLDLVPVVARNAAELQRPAYEITDKGGTADYLDSSDWMLVGPDTHMFVLLGFEGAPIIRRGAPRRLRTWTDDFSNLFQILK